MKFDSQTALQVREGTKTVVHLPAPTRGYGYRPKPGGTEVVQPFRPKVGDVWSTSWESTDKAGKVNRWTVHYRATSVLLEPIRMVSNEEAAAAGYEGEPRASNEDSPDFDRKKRAFEAHEVFAVKYVERFEREWIKTTTAKDGVEPDKWFKLARFDCDLIARPAMWFVIGLEYVADHPVILPKLPREPEAIDPETRWFKDMVASRWDAHDNARVKFEKAARKDRQLLDVEERLKRAREAARMNHVNVSSETFLLRRSLRERRSDAAIQQRLAVLEKSAYREVA